MNHDVFISYKSQDIQITKALVHFIEREGISCWYAPRNLDKQDAGKDYDDKIVDAIKASKIVVVLLSDEALKSDWVKIEVTCAMNNNKFIIPYVIRELTVDNGLFNRLTAKHWIDAYPSPEKKFSILLNNIILERNRYGESTKQITIVSDWESDYDYDYEEGEVLLQANEITDAISAFLTSAEKGNAKAQKRLCEIFFHTEIDTIPVSEETWETIDQQAKAGHCYANFLMHTRFYEEFNSELISFEYLKKALKDKSIPEAYLRMGIHNGAGIGIKQNHTLEMHYYQKAVEMGLDTALSYIGQVHETGNTKYERNIELALDYYRKGEAKNDKRSMECLFHLLDSDCRLGDKKRAREVADKAINCGYNEGLIWMGDSFIPENLSDDIKDYQDSLYWYKKAAQKNIRKSYSSLSKVYWNTCQYETAVQWAKTGATRNDIDSYRLLGHYYEKEYESGLLSNYWMFHEGDTEYLKKSWTYYLKYYLKSRNGAENLARLYLDKNYRPDEEKFSIDNLIHYLEDCAKNTDSGCIEYLIQIFSEPYDKHKILKYYKLGAQVGIEKYMYEYALSFFDEEDKKLYNPYEGISWLEKGAQRKHKESLDKLIEIYSKGVYYDTLKREQWCDFAIANNMADSSNGNIIRHIMNCSEYKDYYAKYLIDALVDIRNTDKIRGEIYRTLISWHHIPGRELSGNTYTTLVDQVRKQIVHNKSLSYAQGIMNYLYPEFDHRKLEDNSVSPDADLLHKYYLMNSTQWEIKATEQDRILDRIYKDFIDDVSFKKVCKQGLLIIREHNTRTYWNSLKSHGSILESYKNLCSHYGCEEIETVSFDTRKIHPFISSAFIVELREWAAQSLLSLIKLGHEPFNRISITSSDKYLMEICDKETNSLVCQYLNGYKRLMIETEDILMKNYEIMMQYIAKDYNQIISDLTEYRYQIEKHKIKHNLPDINEEYISSIRMSDDFYKTGDDFDWPDYDNFFEEDSHKVSNIKDDTPKISDFPEYFTEEEW